ncbi:MAG TPA: molybdenum cofactor guanylyltransferase [Planctomycetota bacterium]|nr:molybdenum cofactor guanylyltransferase [Planctomycetota bacterium]
MTDLAVAILAGGASRRMGRDKALLTIGGETLLHRTARIGAEFGEIIVVGRRRPGDWDLPATFIPDDRPGEGPLAAIDSVLAQTPYPTLVIPCDLPRLDPAALRWVIDSWTAAAPRSGFITLRSGRAEPLFGIYTQAARTAIDDALEQGERSIQKVITASTFARREIPIALAPALDDCDDAADWLRLGGDPL